ncbi:MAG TPA: hypothetical protein VM869_17590 [Enhygromyxa sp.]|nr:hypothetical protein [Enhygromyxa sp.]
MLSGCGLLEVGPASRITEIEPVSFRVRVVELGPHDPERVFYPSDAPVSEFLPGDRVRFEVEVVDVDGLALADDELDSVWLLLSQPEEEGGGGMVLLDDPWLDLRCDELESWTLSTPCRLGEGRGSIEFEAPPLGDKAYVNHSLWVYTAIAWNGQSAEDCWTARRTNQIVPSDCGFMYATPRVGPTWWLLAHAVSEGVATSLPVEHFHPALFLQQANRPPQLVRMEVELAGATMELTPSDGIIGPIAVEPGQRLRMTAGLDENQQFAQSMFVPLDFAGDVFTLMPELVFVRVATAGPITVAQPNPLPATEAIVVEIDQHAEPGLARMVLAIHDQRGAEEVVRVELEIQ